jgi:hypothetical protein
MAPWAGLVILVTPVKEGKSVNNPARPFGVERYGFIYCKHLLLNILRQYSAQIPIGFEGTDHGPGHARRLAFSLSQPFPVGAAIAVVYEIRRTGRCEAVG